jgi:hypothetical protein
MLFSGPKKLSLSLVLILMSSALFAEDFGIAIPDQLSDGAVESSEVEDNSNFGNHLMGSSKEKEDSWQASESEDFAFTKENKVENNELSDKEEALSYGSGTPFEMESKDQILKYKNDEIFKKIYSKGQSSFSFTYIQDSFDVKDAANVFERSFNAETGTTRGGTLHLFFDNYITRSFISPFWGGGFGVGYSQGKGVFSQSTDIESNVRFQLFTVPLDFRLGMDIGRGEYFKLSVAGGPSVVGLLQTRSDKERDERGENGRYRRQVGYGFFGHAKAQVSLSTIASDMAFDTYTQYDMTNMYLNLEARFQSYENFQDDISISGLSFGIGLSFEYL